MHRLKHGLIVALVLALMGSNVCSCLAAENEIEEIFKSGFYGGLAGTLVGGAILAFTDKPSDHLDYLGYGAAVGVLAGMTFGLVKQTRALAEIDNGRVKFALPTVIPELRTTTGGGSALAFRTELISGRF